MLLLMRSDHITNENLWGEEEKKRGRREGSMRKRRVSFVAARRTKSFVSQPGDKTFKNPLV